MSDTMRTTLALAVLVLMAVLVLAWGLSQELGESAQAGCTVTVEPGQSIQQAIDGAPEGAVICLSVGIFREHLAIAKSLTLRGAGPDQTYLYGPTLDNPVIHIGTSQLQAFEILIEGLTLSLKGARIIGIDEDIDAGGLYIWSSGQITIREVHITEASRFGLFASGAPRVILEDAEISNNGVGVFVGGQAQAVILQTRIARNGNGVDVGGSAQATLTHVQIAENELDGLAVTDEAVVEIQGSRFINNRGCGLTVLSKKARVQGTPNEMEGNAADLCAFAPAAVRKPLALPTQRTQVTVPVDYPSIQQAIDSIASQGTIVVQPGTYEVGLTFWKPVTLRGAGPNETILQAFPQQQLIASIIAEAGHVTIEGLTMRGSEGVGLELYGEATLHKVKISDNRSIGLSLKDEARLRFLQGEISGNRVGLRAQDKAQAELSHTLTSGNGVGLELILEAQMRIYDSTIAKNTSSGISVSVSAQLGLFNSSVVNNGDDGLSLGGFQPKVWVINSQIQGNGTQEDCRQPGPEHHKICNGIEVEGGAQLILIDSVIRDNADWGVATWLASCGYEGDQFEGQVLLAGENVIVDNNRSSNHQGQDDLCLPPQLPPGCTLLATPEQSLQRLINKAPEGAVICLSAGTWFENLTIQKSLTLRSGLNSFIKGLEPDQPVISIQSDSPLQVTLDGIDGYFSIQGARAAHSKDLSCLESCPFGIVVQGPIEVVLRGIEITGNDLGGLDIGGAAHVRLQEANLVENGWLGIRLRDSAQLQVEGSMISEHGLGIFATDTAEAELIHSRIYYASFAGVFLAGEAHVRLKEVQLEDNDRYGIMVTERSELDTSTTSISGLIGLIAVGSSWISLKSSTLSGWTTGLEVRGSAAFIAHGTSIVGSGSSPDCRYPRRLCNGITVAEQAQVLLINSEVRGNADWGLAAWLKQCGYGKDTFSGQVIFMGQNAITENNRSGNQNELGNPGDHPFTDLLDGQVCLP